MSSWWTPSKPGQIKPIPWLSPEATAYLGEILQPDFGVIEHGSGGSTLWMAERVKQVISFEGDEDWYGILKKQVPSNATLISGAMQKSPLVPKMEMLTGFDLVLIDGEPVKDRAKWITAAPTLVKPSGWIVLDNANRPEYKAEREGLKQFADLIKTFDGNGGHHQYLVTEFWRVK